MIITLSGVPGSGKSSIANALARMLRFDLYSAGDARRDIAKSMGITLEELNKKAERDPSSDILVDEHLKTLVGRDLVVDARLGFYFIPESIKVFVDADEQVRAERIFKASRRVEKFANVQAAARSIRKRVESDIKRYQSLYGINPYDVNHYDLVLDASSTDIDSLAGQVYRFAMMKENTRR